VKSTVGPATRTRRQQIPYLCRILRLSSGSSGFVRRYERGCFGESGRRGIGEVLWRCSRNCARSGEGGLRVLQMYLKSGGVPAVLGGAIISMGRRLEKPGPKRLFTRVRGRGFSEVRGSILRLHGSGPEPHDRLERRAEPRLDKEAKAGSVSSSLAKHPRWALVRLRFSAEGSCLPGHHYDEYYPYWCGTLRARLINFPSQSGSAHLCPVWAATGDAARGRPRGARSLLLMRPKVTNIDQRNSVYAPSDPMP